MNKISNSKAKKNTLSEQKKSERHRQIKNYVSVLSASFGDGHNSAAYGAVEALNLMNIPNSGLYDLLQKSHPITMECLMNGYRLVTTKWPASWKKLYDLADRIHFGDGSFDLLPHVTKSLADYLKITTPDSVISTYPLYGQIIERLFGHEKLPFKFVTMVTDSKSINKSWLHKAQGDFAVLDKASANFFLNHGISKDRIHITGFPVSPTYNKTRIIECEKNIPETFKILYTPTSNTSHVLDVTKTLSDLIKKTSQKISLTIVMGRHEKRLEKTLKAISPQETTLIGWTENMPSLLCSHHLVIGKAGGASVQESLASGCPMIIDSMIPGQEEGNADFITGLGCGVAAFTPEEINLAILSLIKNDGQKWLKMRHNCFSKGSPQAALNLAKLVT